MSPPCGTKGWFGHKIHEHRALKNVMLTHWSGASIRCFAMILSWIILIFPRSRGLKKKEKLYCHRKQKLCDDCVDLFSLLLWHQSWGFFSWYSGRCYCWSSCLHVYKYYLAVSVRDNIRFFSQTRPHETFSRVFGSQQKAISFLCIWSLNLLKIHFQSLNLCLQTWTLVVSSCKNWQRGQ